MSSPVEATCRTCHAAVPPDSSFCTRCGAVLTLREIPADVGRGQQWGGRAPRERAGRSGAATGSAVPDGPGVNAVPGVPGVPAVRTVMPFAQPSQAVVQADVWREVSAGLPAVQPSASPLGPAFDGVEPAGTARRVGAYALDLAAVLLVAGTVWWFTRSAVYAGLAAAELVAGLVVWEARSGRTVGNSVLGLRTAQDDVPFAPGLVRSVARAVVLGAAHLLLGVGQWLVVASSAFDRSGRRQAWHDALAGTVVVDIRALRREDAPVAFQPPVVTGPEPAAPGEGRVPAPPAPEAAVPAPVAAPVATPSASSAPASVPGLPAVPAVRSSPAQAPVPPTAVAPASGPVPPPPPGAATEPATSYVVTLDDGQAMSVSGPGYVGRRPQAPAGERVDHVIAIDDPGRSLSRTHARFGIDENGFWVEDNGSANGTSVVAHDGTAVHGDPGERLTVPPGGTVRLGERTFTVHPYP